MVLHEKVRSISVDKYHEQNERSQSILVKSRQFMFLKLKRVRENEPIPAKAHNARGT
jgi:hypothetical protein